MGATSYYFDRLLPRLESNGTDVDVIGYSYYPLHHYEPDDCDPNNRGCGSMKDVRENLIYTATEFKLPVALVEVGFASRDEPGADYEFEVSQQGQKDFLEATVDALKAVPNDMGWGLFWWYAEAVPVDDFGTVWKYGSYGLFDKGVNWPDYNPDSEALPAQEVFAEIAAEFSALPGDFDFDVDVDGADFLILQAQFGSTGLLAADADGDFRVNSEDLEVWESQYGETSLTAALATVPEPTGLLLFGTFLVWNQVLGPRSLRSRG